MKRKTGVTPALTLAALLLGLTSLPWAQEEQIRRKNVPAVVLAAFEKTYPNATIKGYSKEMDNGQLVYEIESVEGTVTRDVTYTADGTLVSVEETLEISALPPKVKAALDRKFPGGKIRKAEKITKGAVVAYEFKIRHNGRTSEIAFDPEGNELQI
ncbi:MAG TPA: PepSY domain-containing protein [Candidatus Xenobia bacterium]|nr:PepSY domain-containing protein [Candidatus Xenobia bacterium]